MNLSVSDWEFREKTDCSKVRSYNFWTPTPTPAQHPYFCRVVYLEAPGEREKKACCPGLNTPHSPSNSQPKRLQQGFISGFHFSLK